MTRVGAPPALMATRTIPLGINGYTRAVGSQQH